MRESGCGDRLRTAIKLVTTASGLLSCVESAPRRRYRAQTLSACTPMAAGQGCATDCGRAIVACSGTVLHLQFAEMLLRRLPRGILVAHELEHELVERLLVGGHNFLLLVCRRSKQVSIQTSLATTEASDWPIRLCGSRQARGCALPTLTIMRTIRRRRGLAPTDGTPAQLTMRVAANCTGNRHGDAAFAGARMLGP